MSIRRLAYPGTMLQSMSPIVVTQKSFGGAMNSDDPSTEIGADELADIFNKIAFPKYLRGRTGCRLMGSIRLPVITDYRITIDIPYIGASKVGSKVSLFPYEDGVRVSDLVRGQYLVWPDGTRDMIKTIATSGPGSPYFISSFGGSKPLGDCYQQGRAWGAVYSDQNEKIIVHLGKKLYFIGIDFLGYTEIPCVGTNGLESLAESRTRFDSDDDQIIAFNANGIYRIVFDENTAYYFKINNGQPATRIHENTSLPAKAYGRNRLYTCLRITGPGCLFGDRQTKDCIVQQETAPVLPDSNHKDMSIGYTDIPIGLGAGQYQELASGPGLVKTPATWAYADASFGITMTIGGGVEGPYDILTDLVGALTMDEVTARIQASLRRIPAFSDAECYYRSSGSLQQIVINPGRSDGRLMGFVTTPATGTDVTTLMDMNAGTSNGIKTMMPIDAPQLTYGYNADVLKNTHFGVYASKNATPEAVANLGNIADFLIWAKDIPIIKAMRVTYYSNIVTAVGGEKVFDKADEGSFFTRAADDGSGEREIFQLGSIVGPNNLPSTNERENQAEWVSGHEGVIAMGAKKLNQAYQYGNKVFFDPETYQNLWNLPSASDIGKILFVEDGSVRHIVGFDPADTSFIVHEEVNFGHGGTPTEYLAVAWDPILHSSAADSGEDSKIIIFDKSSGHPPSNLNRISGDVFDASDIGKKIFAFKDGQYWTLGTVTDVSDENTAVGDSTSAVSWSKIPDKGVYAVISSFMPARFYKDYVVDSVLASRQDDPYFALQTRFFRPLPSSCSGALGSNFLFVAEQETNKIKYSEMPEARKYIVGFHHLTWQSDSKIQDEITHLKNYPDRMVAFCRKSTWGSNTSAFTSIKEPAIGEEIFTVPIFTVIADQGLVHLDSIQDISVGQSILMCEDASVRSFDGRQFSENDFSQNKVHKSLRLWHNRVMSSYDANGGYMLFGSPNVSSDDVNFVNMSTGSCYKLSLLPSQGQWWSRFGGLQMVSPMPYTCGLSIDDSNDMTLQVILDERTGQWFQINTYNGPGGSGLVETLVDKENTEIAMSIKALCHRGQRQSISLEHLESHVHIAPLVQGQAYRTGFAVTSKIYVDNGVTYFAKTIDTPIDGDVVYDRKAQSKHLQSEYEFSTSGIVVSEIETIYNTKDTAGATAMETSESTNQRRYSGQ